MSQDHIGNKKSTFATLGASNHSNLQRIERDFYATHPSAIYKLFDKFRGFFSNNIWEPACGNGHLSKALIEYDPVKQIRYSDIVRRDLPCEIIDFLQQNETWKGDIITNPPYKYALEFVDKALQTIEDGYKVAMFLKLTFLEGQKRRKFFEKFPPKFVAVFSARMKVARNGDEEMFKESSAACYAWFVWEKGNTKNPIIYWI